jgi:hypothetical protein
MPIRIAIERTQIVRCSVLPAFAPTMMCGCPPANLTPPKKSRRFFLRQLFVVIGEHHAGSAKILSRNRENLIGGIERSERNRRWVRGRVERAYMEHDPLTVARRSIRADECPSWASNTSGYQPAHSDDERNPEPPVTKSSSASQKSAVLANIGGITASEGRGNRRRGRPVSSLQPA